MINKQTGESEKKSDLKKKKKNLKVLFSVLNVSVSASGFYFFTKNVHVLSEWGDCQLGLQLSPVSPA